MERTDWLDKGFTSSDGCFLMVTAITHHRCDSKLWGEEEVAKLQAELAEIDAAGEAVLQGERGRSRLLKRPAHISPDLPIEVVSCDL